MATECQLIQEALAEHRGEVGRLDDVSRRHLDSCPECCEVAAAERALGAIFRNAVPPADASLQAAVVASLRPVRRRRRMVAFLPVAASVLIAAVGALLVGGLPGIGVLGLLPGWSSQAGLAAAGSISEWLEVASAGMQAAAAALDPRAVAAAAVLGLLGFGGVVAVALRWRKISPWRDRL